MAASVPDVSVALLARVACMSNRGAGGSGGFDALTMKRHEGA